MSLFEYLFERRNPGRVGGIEENKEPVKEISAPVLTIKILVSALIVYILFHYTIYQNLNLFNLAVFLILLFIYCFIGYRFIPRPDTSNVGLLGGLIDNPFRYTDDLNRMLIFILILLYPGRFIATTFIQTVKLFKRSGKK